jgi:hypothetical protein
MARKPAIRKSRVRSPLGPPVGKSRQVIPPTIGPLGGDVRRSNNVPRKQPWRGGGPSGFGSRS